MCIRRRETPSPELARSAFVVIRLSLVVYALTPQLSVDIALDSRAEPQTARLIQADHDGRRMPEQALVVWIEVPVLSRPFKLTVATPFAIVSVHGHLHQIPLQKTCLPLFPIIAASLYRPLRLVGTPLTKPFTRAGFIAVSRHRPSLAPPYTNQDISKNIAVR